MNEYPPLMGFPQEEIGEPSWCVPFYTCVIGPFRIYVYSVGGIHHDEEWMMERTINIPDKRADQQFFNSSGVQWTVPSDPLTVKALIHNVTSESNDEVPTSTPSAVDCVSALADEIRHAYFSDRGREGRSVGTPVTDDNTSDKVPRSLHHYAREISGG